MSHRGQKPPYLDVRLTSYCLMQSLDPGWERLHQQGRAMRRFVGALLLCCALAVVLAVVLLRLSVTGEVHEPLRNARRQGEILPHTFLSPMGKGLFGKDRMSSLKPRRAQYFKEPNPRRLRTNRRSTRQIGQEAHGQLDGDRPSDCSTAPGRTPACTGRPISSKKSTNGSMSWS